MKTKCFRNCILEVASIKSAHNIVVLGASAGGFQALKNILTEIKRPLNLSLLVVIHRLNNVHSLIEEVFANSGVVAVKEAQQGEKLELNTVYINPADYHMKISEQLTIELSHSEPINFSRPSIDYTMTHAARLLKNKATGIILTGANVDGADGLRQIHDHGGTCIVQYPGEAAYPHMPESAATFVKDAQILTLRDISRLLQSTPLV